MGIYYQATALIGYKISLDKFKSKNTVRSCDHITNNAKFCPECGVKVKTYSETIWADEWDDLYELLNERCPTGLTWEHDGESDKAPLYIGYGTKADPSEVDMVRILPVEAIKELVAQTLEPFKQFVELDESTFGLYAIHFGS